MGRRLTGSRARRFVVYAYFSEVLPQLYLDVGSPGAELWTLIGLWMLFNLFYNCARWLASACFARSLC